MKIVLHQCCAPCSAYPLKQLLESGVEVHGFFYNPNIHPYTEFKLRMENVISYNDKCGIRSTVDSEYGLDEFMQMWKSETYPSRCEGCYDIRLHKTAKFAAENGFDAFTSTLMYSVYQNHALMCEIAEKYAKMYNVKFYYEDFRKGWQEGIAISKQEEMYRQKYCGCIFSEQERYIKQKRK